MALFTVYSSSDAGAGNPGLMFGAAGDLIRVLDKILVDGWTGKAAAGWTHPVATAGNIASYKNASTANGGNGFGVVVNDNGPNVTSTYKEAWATGWESVAGVGSPVGSGSGQFPTAAQLLTTGHVVVRKSTTADGTNGRAWICFADSLTFYMFIASADIAGAYMPFWFGDFFSLKGSTDTYRGFILGRATENSGATGATINNDDILHTYDVTSANSVGMYAARGYGGGGASVQLIHTGAMGTSASPASGRTPNIGLLTAANGPDNAYYTPNIWVSEFSAKMLRGRYRGIYHSAHPLATWSDGQVINGAGDLAGKTLQAVVKSATSGMWFVETSNTVETN